MTGVSSYHINLAVSYIQCLFLTQTSIYYLDGEINAQLDTVITLQRSLLIMGKFWQEKAWTWYIGMELLEHELLTANEI